MRGGGGEDRSASIKVEPQGLGFAKVKSNSGPEERMEQQTQRKQAQRPVVGVKVSQKQQPV